jgi:hypothetical protein
MPRAVWRGFLRLSLVSCPIYLSPATTRTKSIRLHQVWQPASVEEPDETTPARGRKQDVSDMPTARAAVRDDVASHEDYQSAAATDHAAALLIQAPARKLRSEKSSRATSTSAAISSRLLRRSSKHSISNAPK